MTDQTERVVLDLVQLVAGEGQVAAVAVGGEVEEEVRRFPQRAG